MGIFSDLLMGKQRDPVQASQGYFNQIPGIAHKNLDPYIMPGEQAQGFVDKILASYKPSQGYQFKENRLKQGLANTAAAGGFSGTQYDQEQQGALMNSLMGDDMQQYLQNVLGVHNNSFNASNALNDIEGGAMQQQGTMAFGQAEAGNQRNADLRSALLKLLGTGAGAFLGRPTGAAVGGSIGGGLSNLFNRNRSGQTGNAMPMQQNTTRPGASFMGGNSGY